MTRETGVLVDWHDERGFGFIRRPGQRWQNLRPHEVDRQKRRPAQAWRQARIHRRRGQGRPAGCGRRQVLVRDAPSPPPPPTPLLEAHSHAPHTVLGIATRVVGAAVILALLSANIITERLPVWIAALYLIAGVGSFLLYRADKLAAVGQGWRKPEMPAAASRPHLRHCRRPVCPARLPPQDLQARLRQSITALITALHILVLGLILFGVYAPGSVGDFFRQT